jgi:DHA2 family multidrug resistance protein
LAQGAVNIQEEGWSPLAPPIVVTLSVMLAVFMEVLDSTVVNVSLPHIAGTLGAAIDESTWVATSYLVSNAIVLPATGWLSRAFGRKRFYMACVVAFTLSSLLCGFAPSLLWLIVFRVMQGLGGGALQPVSQAILLETYPLRKRGMGMALFGIGVIFAPIIGPTLGGWITDNFSWRWIFFINIPVGALSLLLTQLFVADPPYLKRAAGRVDYFGLGLLAVGIGALQMVLDKGQREDWFQTSWIMQLAILSAVCIVVLVIWELRIKNPIVDLRVLLFKNFASGTTLMFVLGLSLYGSLILVPLFQQQLLGYTATLAGLAQSPQGLASLICMPIVGLLVAKADTRYMLVFGLALLAVALFMMSRWTLDISFWQAVWPRIVFGVGMSFLFVPITATCVAFVPPERMGNATGIFNLFRNVGGSIGVALMTTLLAQRSQFHQSRLIERVNQYSYPYQFMYGRLLHGLMGRGESEFAAHKLATGVVYSLVQRQASAMAFVDCFWIVMFLALATLPLILTMKRPPKHGPRPGPGTH